MEHGNLHFVDRRYEVIAKWRKAEVSIPTPREVHTAFEAAPARLSGLPSVVGGATGNQTRRSDLAKITRLLRASPVVCAPSSYP
ncbi:hypothetical protein CCP3SC15_4910001 [Gammaproteobacteria bacterium]